MTNNFLLPVFLMFFSMKIVSIVKSYFKLSTYLTTYLYFFNSHSVIEIITTVPIHISPTIRTHFLLFFQGTANYLLLAT